MLKVHAIGYDQSVPRGYSIGKTANFYAIEDSIREGLVEYDLSRGTESYKKWLGGEVQANFHLRVHRSRLDEMLECLGPRLCSRLRSLECARLVYHILQRRRRASV